MDLIVFNVKDPMHNYTGMRIRCTMSLSEELPTSFTMYLIHLKVIKNILISPILDTVAKHFIRVEASGLSGYR